MRGLLVVSLVGLAGCHAIDWRAKAIDDAEALVRRQINDPTLRFAHVQYTGDGRTGQTCGYFQRPNAVGGTDGIRFISSIDGGGGQNPYIDELSAPYPKYKGDFELNWRTQCVALGYKD